MGIIKATKKPVTVEAVLVTEDNILEVAVWCNGQVAGQDEEFNSARIYIFTLEGTMTALVGDYVIKGIKGEFYPCKSDIFTDSYDPA